jgi:hypothetical protein
MSIFALFEVVVAGGFERCHTSGRNQNSGGFLLGADVPSLRKTKPAQDATHQGLYWRRVL